METKSTLYQGSETYPTHPMNFVIEFEDQKQASLVSKQGNDKESPLLSYLRSKHNESLAKTTFHTVSTALSSFDPSRFTYNDEDSACSLDLFSGDLGEDQDDSFLFDCDPIDAALRISQESVESFAEEEFMNEEEEYEDDCFLPETTPSHFHDSMGSLNDAFEKLQACMARTEQTRRLVREFANDCEVEIPIPQRPVSLNRSNHSQISLLSGHSSSRSLSSIGSSGIKGRKTYAKKKLKKNLRKDLRKELNRQSTSYVTGVRPSLSAI